MRFGQSLKKKSPCLCSPELELSSAMVVFFKVLLLCKQVKDKTKTEVPFSSLLRMWFHTEFNQSLADAERGSAATSAFWYFDLNPLNIG